MPHKKAKRSLREIATAARGYDNAPTVNDSYTIPYSAPSTSATPDTPAPAEPTKKRPRKSNPSDKLNSFGGREEFGGLSKSVHRILNATATREEYHAAKRAKKEEETAKANKKAGNANKPLVMLPYESVGAFNRRVESTMRPSIDIAIKASKSANKKRAAKKPKLDDPSVLADAIKANETNPKGKGKEAIDPLIPKPKPQIVRTGPTEFARPSQIKNITDIAMAPPTLKKRKIVSTSDPLPAHRMPVSEGIRVAMEREREKAVQGYRVLKEKRELEQRAEQAL